VPFVPDTFDALTPLTRPISGGIDGEDEKIRGYWQTMFKRALEDNFDDPADKKVSGNPVSSARSASVSRRDGLGDGLPTG